MRHFIHIFLIPLTRFKMPYSKTKLLIVDDKLSIRTSLSLLLTEIGYSVRCAVEGFPRSMSEEQMHLRRHGNHPFECPADGFITRRLP